MVTSDPNPVFLFVVASDRILWSQVTAMPGKSFRRLHFLIFKSFSSLKTPYQFYVIMWALGISNVKEDYFSGAWDLEGLEDDLQLAKACLTWFPEPGKHFKKLDLILLLHKLIVLGRFGEDSSYAHRFRHLNCKLASCKASVGLHEDGSGLLAELRVFDDSLSKDRRSNSSLPTTVRELFAFMIHAWHLFHFCNLKLFFQLHRIISAFQNKSFDRRIISMLRRACGILKGCEMIWAWQRTPERRRENEQKQKG